VRGIAPAQGRFVLIGRTHVLVAALVTAAAVMAIAPGPADAGIDRACVNSCRAQNNQCRVATKNSPSCDSQLQSCLDSCRR